MRLSQSLRPIIVHSMLRSFLSLIVGFVVVTLSLPSIAHAQLVEPTLRSSRFRTIEHSDRVDLFDGEHLVTSYLFRSGSKPVLWPVYGPDHLKMTRDYPMIADTPGEDHDHVHHRSIWMTFGDVNGIDFWAEGAGKGSIEHRAILAKDANDEHATVMASHDWMQLDGSGPLLTERCRYTVSGSEDERIIDCEYLLKNVLTNPAQPVRFGDTKEGMFGVRVPESMRADKSGGQILNQAGRINADAWGRSSPWVDYSGKVKHSAEQSANDHDKDYGIAILVHPSSFRSNGCWHVRTYGLFAHNPFGIKDFFEGRPASNDTADQRPHSGEFELESGKTIHLFYRIILHRNRWTIDEGNARYKNFESVQMRLLP